MSWKITSYRPVYLQLAEEIELRIVSGEYPPGSRLLGVREFAADAVVNPNTMQKAFSELERQGLVYAQRTAGRYVTDDTLLISNRQSQLLKSVTKEYLAKLKRLGVSPDTAAELLKVGDIE